MFSTSFTIFLFRPCVPGGSGLRNSVGYALSLRVLFFLALPKASSSDSDYELEEVDEPVVRLIGETHAEEVSEDETTLGSPSLEDPSRSSSLSSAS